MMEIITKKLILETLADRWRAQYPRDRPFVNSKLTSDQIYNRLKTENLSEWEINQIIGNKSWTRNQCEICEKDQNKVIAFKHHETDIRVCQNCIETALNMLKDED